MRPLFIIVVFIMTIFVHSTTYADLRPGYVKVGFEDQCPKGTLENWVVASSDELFTCGAGNYYTPFFFANYGDRVRVRVNCNSCQLKNFDFTWWDAVQNYFRNSIDVERYLEGKNAYVGDESESICKDTWDEQDYWMKLKWSYTKNSGLITWWWQPYFGEWLNCGN